MIYMKETIGIAFSGGGAKSIAQIALIEYLENKHIQADFVSGTSAGSLVATLYAMGLKSDVILDEIRAALLTIEEHRLLKISTLDILKSRHVAHGIIEASWLEKLVESITSKYGMHHLSDVKIPLAITAVDIYTGELVIFVSHPHLYNNNHPRSQVISNVNLAQAIRASMSFPLVFGSFNYEDFYLIDGGIRMNCPVPMLRDYGADKTLAITMRGRIDNEQHIEKALEVANRVFELMSREAEERHVGKADCVFNVPLEAVDIFDTKITDVILQKGREAVMSEKASLDAFFKPKTFLQKILNFK